MLLTVPVAGLSICISTTSPSIISVSSLQVITTAFESTSHVIKRIYLPGLQVSACADQKLIKILFLFINEEERINT